MRDYRSNKFNTPFRKAMWLNMGYTPEDFKKPKIAIVNSSNNIAICFSHLDAIAKACAEEIKAAGGMPFEVRTTAPSDFTTVTHDSGYILASRDLIAYDIEASVEGNALDGMICLASCDKTLPGQLIAAARLNIPTLILTCGYQPCGTYRGERFDIDDLFLANGHFAVGKITQDELDEMTVAAVKGPGVCQGIGTANTMHITCEALGLTMPGETPVLANSPAMWDSVKRACTRIVEMVEEDMKPREIMTEAAFANSVKTVLSVSGSTNAIKHLQAAALAAGTDVDIFKMFREFADDIPLLCAIRPNGDYSIDDMEAAGGTLAVMKQLSSKLDLDAMTVSGKTLGENLKDAEVRDDTIIRPLDNAFNYRPAIILAQGNIAENFGVIKLRVDDSFKPSKFTGPAKVFANREIAIAALREGRVQKGDVLVLQGIGITGSPGQGMVSGLFFALDGLGLSRDVAVVTDGHASGLCNMCLGVIDVTPEAAAGGNIGLVRDGDIITIDAMNRNLFLDVSDEELAERRKTAPDFKQDPGEGWLRVFQERARPINEGALLR